MSIVALLVIPALLLGWFVQRSVTEVRDALAEEVLQQQNDVAYLLHEYARVMLSLERANKNPDNLFEVESAMTAANSQLQKMRFQYSFERLDGAASAHAFVKPVLEDVEQWLDQGISDLTSNDPLIFEIAARRMGERYYSLRAIASDAERVATALISEQTTSLDRFRKTLLVMLALTMLSWLGIVASLIRQRNLQTRRRIDSQRHTQRIADFADLGADVFWETDKNQKLSMLFLPALAAEARQEQSIAKVDEPKFTVDSIEFLQRLPLPAIQAQSLFRHHELTFGGTDGSARLLTVSGKPLFSEQGEFQGFRGVGRDITRRKEIERELEQVNHKLLQAQKKGRQQAEQALRDSEQFLRSSLDALTANIAILASDGNIAAINSAWNDYVRTEGSADADGGVGAHYLDVFRMRPAAEYQAVSAYTSSISDVLSGRLDDFYREFPCHTLDKLAWFALHVTTFESNHLRYAVMVYQDVSERKKLEERDHRLRAELAHTARLATAGEMASGLAHELNQPLTAISHNSDALLYAMNANTVADAELKETLTDIYEQAQRAGRIIHSMRQMVKNNAAVTSSININELIRDTVRLSQAEAHEHRIDVQLELAEGLPFTLIDYVQIQQVLLNLERNALEAIRHGNVSERRIVISSVLDNDMVRISVSDTGPGIDEAIQGKLFTSFHTTKEQGMGLGLSISRTIIESHGGRLWVESNTPGVTVFSFTVPVRSD